jgi:hypothetical protein
MDDLSRRDVHMAGIRRKRDFLWNGNGRGGVDSIRVRGNVSVSEVRISQGRADDGEERGNGIRRRNGSYKRVDSYVLILSIGTFVYESVHGGRKVQAAAYEKKRALTLKPMGSVAGKVAIVNVTLMVETGRQVGGRRIRR